MNRRGVLLRGLVGVAGIAVPRLFTRALPGVGAPAAAPAMVIDYETMMAEFHGYALLIGGTVMSAWVGICAGAAPDQQGETP